MTDMSQELVFECLEDHEIASKAGSHKGQILLLKKGQHYFYKKHEGMICLYNIRKLGKDLPHLTVKQFQSLVGMCLRKIHKPQNLTLSYSTFVAHSLNEAAIS